VHEVSLSLYLLVGAILLVSYYIRGIAGYGSGLLAIPMLALFLPLELVVPYVGALDYLASLGHGLHYRRSVHWKEIVVILPVAVLGMGFALYLFTNTDREALKVWLGGFIILYAIYSLLPAPQMKGSRLWVLPFAATGGVVDTLFGTGGPFYVIYLRMRQLGKTPFVATIAMAFMINTGIRLLGYLLVGFYSLKILLMILASLPLVFVGMRLGMHTHNRLSAQQFTWVIAGLLILAGLALLLRA
jgi:uncharacterized membrane protein YfcA